MSPSPSARLLGALAALALAACPTPPQPPAEAPSAPKPPDGQAWLTAQQVQDAKLAIAPVEQRVVDDRVNTSGKVAFDDLKVSHVFSPVTGRVTKILVQPGQRVKKGDPLLVLESPDVGQVYSDLDKAQADLIAAEHDYHRAKEMYEAKAGTQRDYEAAEDNYRKAQAELSRCEQKARLFSASNANRVTQEYLLRATLPGEVISRSVNPGAEVQGQYSGGNAMELFTIGELDPIWVMADLFELDQARVKVGAPVEVTVAAYPGKLFEGKVDWISDALDPTTRSAKVRCVLSNNDPDFKLKPEMFAQVSLSATARQALAIPRSAVLRLGEQTVVYVEAGKAPDGRQIYERRPVSVNEDLGSPFVPVLRGLNAGERVVSSGAILLSETS
jgi:cobalt-zinc-cadmium efflux system membrane fusion protein